MNQYQELKQKHFEELNNFPFLVAFDSIGLGFGLKKLGLKPTDTDKITLVNKSVFVKNEDVQAWKEMIARHKKEMREAIKNDKTGTGFIYDMFFYELNNHEYGYTFDDKDTIEILGYSRKDIENNPSLKNGLQLAKDKIRQLENEKEDSEFEYE